VHKDKIMALRLITVGKLSSSFLVAAEAEYAKRLRPHLKIAVLEISNSKSQDASLAMLDEGKRILASLKLREALIVLGENGDSVSSPKFAKLLEKILSAGDATFVIGGAFGLSAEVKERALHTLSLSALTFTYQFARVILFEQLYRATCINRGVGYHKE